MHSLGIIEIGCCDYVCFVLFCGQEKKWKEESGEGVVWGVERGIH